MSLVTPRKGYKSVPWLFGKEIEIPQEWEVKRVGSISKIKGGKRLPKGEPFSKDKTNHPYLRVTDFGTNTIYEKNLEYVTDDIFKKIKNYTISSENVYISIAGTIGLAGLIPKSLDGASLTENACKIIVTKQIIKEYLSIILNSKPIQDQIKSYLGITSQPKLALFRIEKLQFPLPPLPEQQKIANILSNVDNLIELTGKVITHSKKVKKGLMQKLLTQGIGHTKFKEYFFTINGVISLGTIPSEWDISTINELNENDTIIDFQDGNHGELHPKKDDFINKGIPFLTASQIDENGMVDLLNSKKLPELFLNTLRIGFSKSKDVLFTHNATVGRVAVLPKNFPDCIVGTSVTYYRLDETKLNGIFFSYVLRSKFIKTQYGTEIDQTTRQQFSIRKQAKLKIPVPSLPEQQKIATILSNIDSKITSQEQYKENLEKLKKSLMQKLLTGEVRV
jgi:type I restriction enzyme, S subunit